MANGMLNNFGASEGDPMSSPVDSAQPSGAPSPVQPGQPSVQPGQPVPRPERDYQANPLNEKDMGELNKFISMATAVIHAPQTRPKILDRLKGIEHPFEEIADASLVVLNRLEQEASKQGQPWDQAITLMGGTNIVNQITELALASGKLRQEPSERDMKLIVAKATKKYYNQKMANGEISPQEAARDAALAARARAQIEEVDTGEQDKRVEMTEKFRREGLLDTPQSPDLDNNTSIEGGPTDPFKPSTTVSAELSRRGGLLNG